MILNDKITETADTLSNKKGLSSMLKKNIKKAFSSGIDLFKNNKKNDSDNCSSSSNDSISTNEKITAVSLKEHTANLFLNVSDQIEKRHHNSYSSSYSSNDSDNIITYNSEYSGNTNVDKNILSVKPVSDEDEAELQRTLSSENIFMEISKQCLEITSPINSEPIIKEPIIDELIEKPIIEKPIIEKPIIEEPIEESIEESIIDKPIIEDAVIEDAVIEEPIIDEPIIDEVIEDSEEKQSDDNISVLTFDNCIEQKDDETSKETEQKKKRQYKPRKKKI